MPANGRAVVPVTQYHKHLSRFREGTWNVSQRFFPGPDTEPIIRKGTAYYRLLLDGRVAVLETEMEDGFQSLGVFTFNSNSGELEGQYIDIHSFDGFDPVQGIAITELPLTKTEADIDFSADAVFRGPTRERVWKSRLTVPHLAPIADGAPAQLTSVDSLPVQIIENKVSDDHWVLHILSADVTGNPFVLMENSYTYRQEPTPADAEQDYST